MTDAPPMVCYWRGVIDSLVNKLTGAKEMHPKVDTLLEDLLTLRDDLVVNKFAGARPWQVQVWMRQNRKLFYDIEDIIDLKLSKIKDVHESDSDDFAKQIDQFKARIKEARDRGRRYNLPDKARTFDADRREDAAPSKVPFGSRLIWEKKGVLVGIGGPREELEDHLEDTQKKKVVSVHGMGGVGKTTLATKVYEEFIGQFDCHASVTVGRNSSIAVLMDVLLQVNPVMVGRDLKEQDVIPQLWEFLEKKRYLVFIDDIRNEHAWRVINCALPNNELRSRILVTTRVKNVAMSCSVPPIDAIYEMKRLKEHDSTILLDSMIPAQIEASFEKKCEEMLKMCCGLPLAIIVTSGLLALKSNDLGSLGSLEESSLSMLDQYSPSDGMRNVLDICFADLSLPVKACFLYLSTFPENYNIKKGRLIWRWVAEGFIPKTDQASMWETGEGYFTELICRRLIRPVFDDYSDDQAEACTVHPVIHDFIVSLSRQEDFHTTAAELISGPVPYGTIRRFSVDCSRQENNEADTLQSSGIHLSRVRSLTVFGAAGSVPDLGAFIHLRVLDLEDTKSLDNQQVKRIGLLFMLRYLGLSGTNITRLPQQIMALKHLATLDLRRTKVRELPLFANKKLQSLFAPLITIPEGMGGMEELEELSEVLLDGSHADDVAGFVNKSSRLRVLGVKFGYLAKSELEGMKEFFDEVRKSNLQSLSLHYYPSDSVSSLIECCAHKWPDSMGKFELRMSDCLPLVPLKIARIEALTHLHITVEVVEASGLSTLGKLPNLIVLKLCSVERAQKWLSISNKDGFPSLTVFWFRSSYFDGIGLQFEAEAMPSLQKLKIEFNAKNTMLFNHDYDFGIQSLRGLLQVCAIIHCKNATDSEVKAAEAAIRKQVAIIRCKDATDSEVGADEAARRDQVSQIPYDPLPTHGDCLSPREDVAREPDNCTTSTVDIRISILPESSSYLPLPEEADFPQDGSALSMTTTLSIRNKRGSGGDSSGGDSLRRSLRKEEGGYNYGMEDLSHELDNLEHILDGSKEPSKLNFSVLRHITAHFSLDRKIGEGGYGNVYKGILPRRDKMVAVKRLFNRKMMDERTFQREVATLMSVNHRNIIQFVGYCSHTEEEMFQMTRKYIFAEARERLLCFEYISNGSLEDHITDELRGLEWEKRFQIIRGICEGLSYLHNKGIIHMDLKPPNILLSTDALVPKIADFGTSRLEETTKTMTQERVYSLGYCCPEYIDHGERTFSSDIYSLGVTVIEIVTGTREDNPNISKVRRRWRHRWNESAEHATLLLGLQQVTGCLELAQRCKNKEPTKRPDIVDIIDELKKMNSSDASKSIGEPPSKKQKSIVEQQKKSFLDHMLGIQPLESHFSLKRNEQIATSIQLTNDTEDYVAFMIHESTMDSWVSATRRLTLSMHPSKDILPPESSCSVTITVEALKKPLQEQFVGKLCVQSTRVDEGLKANDITEDMFKEEANKVVDVVDLTVKVSTPKQLLVVEPLELCYGPIQPNKLLPCSLQLTNTTDDYVAFAIILPRSKEIRYYQKICTGIIPPCSTRGFITEILVTEEALAQMRCNDTCLVRSVVVNKDLMEHDVSLELFNEQTGVREMELDIVFAELPQAPSSSVHRPTHEISPFSIETELLHIYPPELRFNCEQDREYISLINKTDRDVIYDTAFNAKGEYIEVVYAGAVPAYTTHSVPVHKLVWEKTRYYQFRIHMISGSRRFLNSDDLNAHFGSDLSYREEVIHGVRAEGGKVHEALLTGINDDDAHPKDKETTLHIDILNMHGLQELSCIDVHHTDPWFVTGHFYGAVCIWKVDPKTNASEVIMSTTDAYKLLDYDIHTVKFIARKKWVACGDSKGYVTVFTYDYDRLIKFKTIENQSRYESPRVNNRVCTLAVHPSLPYLLTIFSESDSIQQWDWDQDWTCTRNFVPPEPKEDYTTMAQITFNPKDDNTFACWRHRDESVGETEITVFSMDSQQGTTGWRGTRADSIAYCSTGVLATVDWAGTIEILDLPSRTRVHTLADTKLLKGNGENERWFMACHPTRPLLAIGNHEGVFLWNCTTYGLQKVFKFPSRKVKQWAPTYYYEGIGFIDVEGFQRLVIASRDTIEIVDILDGLSVFKEIRQMKGSPVMGRCEVKGTCQPRK